MKTFDFCGDWRLEERSSVFDDFCVNQSDSLFYVPRDEMIRGKRLADSINGADNGFYDGRDLTYAKTFFAPEDWEGRRVSLCFEGVMPDATVYVNGHFAGKHMDGYTGFEICISPYLEYGKENEVRVEVHAGILERSRWYIGSGLYRPVWLCIGADAYFPWQGIGITAKSLGDDLAIVEAEIQVETLLSLRREYMLESTIFDTEGKIVGRDVQPITLLGTESVLACGRFEITSPILWDIDNPALYTLNARLIREDQIIDEGCIRFGIRNLEFTHTRGFCLNGRPVKLRGACIHHDNGPLGAVSLKDAEVRKVQRLRAAGFNAIRTAHNPASRFLLEACDEVGMLVMEEAFDVWNTSKRPHDSALFFEETWRDSLESMVRNSRNHPCVILYAIGNEIQETGLPSGASRNRKMAQALRTMDATRPVVNCINGMFSVMGKMGEVLSDVLGDPKQVPTDINAMMTAMDDNLDQVMCHDVVTQSTEETFAGVDICGYNYMHGRYIPDGKRYPNRIIVGSETTAPKIGYNWPVILKLPYVLGDFCWTGWDYLGEGGVAKNDYDQTHMMYGPWPWFIGNCGDFDIVGNRRPQSYYREIVYGLRQQPYLCVEPPRRYNQPKTTTNWTWSDVEERWTWPGDEGQPVHVEVYADADEVALELNGQRIARAIVGEKFPFKALFDVIYHPGTLSAVAYQNAVEIGRASLMTTGDACSFTLEPEVKKIPAQRDRLIYVDVTLRDSQGYWASQKEYTLNAEVSGPVVLAAFANGNACSLEPFNAVTHSTYQGKALIILRTNGQTGTVKLRVTCPELGCQEVAFKIEGR